MTKAEKQELRQREARRRVRLQHFIALLISITDAWEVGLAGGGRTAQAKYAAIETTEKEKKFILSQLGKITKWRREVIDLVGEKSFHVGKQLYTDAERKLKLAERKANDLLDETIPNRDFMAVMTYVLYAAFHDLAILEQDNRRPVRYLIQTLGTLADTLLPADSPHVMAMNRVYYATRDAWQESPEWYPVEWKDAPQMVYFESIGITDPWQEVTA